MPPRIEPQQVGAETLAEKIDEAMGATLDIEDVTQNVIKAKYTGD